MRDLHWARGQRLLGVIVLCLPILVGWEDVDLRSLLAATQAEAQRRVETAKTLQSQLASVTIKPLRILQKSESAMLEANGVKGKTEIWLQHPLLHITMSLNLQYQDPDWSYMEGKASVSFLIPQTRYSTADWIQQFSLGGQSYSYNAEERAWESDSGKLSRKEMSDAIEYDLFASLASPKTSYVVQDSVKLVSLERFNNRDCFVLEYAVDPEPLKKQFHVVVNVDSKKTWIDRQTFYPYLERIEGSIGDTKFVQRVEFYDVNVPVTLKLPQEVSDRVSAAKEGLFQKIDDVSKRISDLRGGSLPTHLKREFINQKALRHHIQEKVKEEPAAQARFMDVLCRWMDLLPPDLDYQEALLNAEVASIGGLYEPKEQTFYIAERIPMHLAEAVMAHELAHAFQDNTIHLDRFLDNPRLTLDQQTARRFLIEGEATAVMLQLVYDTQDRRLEDETDLLTLIEDKLLSGGGSSSRGSLMYSGYAYGARFIQQALKTSTWKDVPKVYRNPPASMKELMHPELYLKQPPGERVKRIVWKAPRLNGWRVVHRDQLGEFMMLMWLSKFLTKQEAETAAGGLGHDEFLLYEHPDRREPLIVWRTEWDTDADAQEFWNAYQAMQSVKWKGKGSKEEQADYVLWRLGDREDLICRRKNRVLIASSAQLNPDILTALLPPLNQALPDATQNPSASAPVTPLPAAP